MSYPDMQGLKCRLWLWSSWIVGDKDVVLRIFGNKILHSSLPMQVANVPASSSSRAPRRVPDERPAVAVGMTPKSLRDLIPGKGSLRGVYLKRIASSHIYQGFYPSILNKFVMFLIFWIFYWMNGLDQSQIQIQNRWPQWPGWDNELSGRLVENQSYKFVICGSSSDYLNPTYLTIMWCFSLVYILFRKLIGVNQIHLY